MSLHSQIDSHKIHEGYLYKQGYWNTSWKKRYFVLYNDRTVDYFKDKSDSTSRNKAKGTIYLTQISRVELVKSMNDKIDSPSMNTNKSFIFHNDSSHSNYTQQGESTADSIRSKQSISMSSFNGNNDYHTLSEEVPFLKASQLKSISEKDETSAPDNTFNNNNCAPNMDRNNGVNMGGVNGWTFGIYNNDNNHSSVISSCQPPPDYNDIIETEKQFEKERERLTKSLLELKQSSTTISPRGDIENRPPTPVHAKKKKKRRGTSTYTFTESEISTYIPCNYDERKKDKDNNHKKMRRAQSADIYQLSKKYKKKIKKLSLHSDNFDITPPQSLISPTFANVECELSDYDDNKEYVLDLNLNLNLNSSTFHNKPIIASDIKKHHRSSISVNNDTYNTECCLTPRDEMDAFKLIMNDTKLGLECDRRYSFALISSGRQWILSSETNDELKEWITLFHKLSQGKEIYDGYLNYNDKFIAKYFILYSNKILNCYNIKEKLDIDFDIDLRHIHYLKFMDENGIEIGIPNYSKKENKIKLYASNKHIAYEWYNHLLSLFNKKLILNKLYDSSVENINIVHSGNQLKSRYIAMYKDYIVIFKDKKQLNDISKMIFFDKNIFRDYTRKEKCILIPLNKNVKIRKASKNNGKYAFLIANIDGDRKWYFSVKSKQIMNEWLHLLISKSAISKSHQTNNSKHKSVPISPKSKQRRRSSNSTSLTKSNKGGSIHRQSHSKSSSSKSRKKHRQRKMEKTTKRAVSNKNYCDIEVESTFSPKSTETRFKYQHPSTITTNNNHNGTVNINLKIESLQSDGTKKQQIISLPVPNLQLDDYSSNETTGSNISILSASYHEPEQGAF